MPRPARRIPARPVITLSASAVVLSALITVSLLTPASASTSPPSPRTKVAQVTTPPRTSTYFSYSSARGDHIGGGKSHRFTPSSSVKVRISGTAHHLSVRATAGKSTWAVDLTPGVGDQFRPGVFPKVETYPTQTGRAPGLRVRANGRTCKAHGSFTVNQIGFNAKGAITMADVSLIQRCGSNTAPALKATIHLKQWPLSYKQASDPNDYVGRGVTRTYYNSTSVMQFKHLTPDFVQLRLTGLGDDWEILMRPPDGTSFVAGKTYATGDQEASGPPLAMLSVTGNGRGCNYYTGNLTIHQISVSADNTITHLYASFTQYCSGSTDALRGTFHYFA